MLFNQQKCVQSINGKTMTEIITVPSHYLVYHKNNLMNVSLFIFNDDSLTINY